MNFFRIFLAGLTLIAPATCADHWFKHRLPNVLIAGASCALSAYDGAITAEYVTGRQGRFYEGNKFLANTDGSVNTFKLSFLKTAICAAQLSSAYFKPNLMFATANSIGAGTFVYIDIHNYRVTHKAPIQPGQVAPRNP